MCKISQASTQQETLRPSVLQQQSDSQRISGNYFELFRKICSNEYDNTKLQQKCKHYSAIGQHYLKTVRDNSPKKFESLENVKKLTSTEEIVLLDDQSNTVDLQTTNRQSDRH